jgi:hypothetical protein
MLVALVAALLLLCAEAAKAAEVDEREPNDSFEQAQNIDDSFDLTYNEEIGRLSGGTNYQHVDTSATIPHATINGTGNETFDYYAFTVPDTAATQGTLTIFDVDHSNQGMYTFDPTIVLYHSSGAFLARGEDGWNDPGSAYPRDAYLEYRFFEPGTYYIAVGGLYTWDWRFPELSHSYPVNQGATYQLHVSVEGHPAMDSAPSVWLQPSARSIVYGDDAEFRAGTSGWPTPTVQWQVSEDNGESWNDIPGATSTPLTLTNPPVSKDGHQYRAVFTNAGDSATSNPATLRVAQRPITVTADAQARDYGDPDPDLSYKVTSPLSTALVGGDTLSGVLAREPGEDVGTYAIHQGSLSDGNYDLTFVGADFTITPRSIVVTADAQTKVYGYSDPQLSYQITSGSLAFNDTLSEVLTGSPEHFGGENAGFYEIHQGTLAARSNNYNLVFESGWLKITPRPIEVTADNQVKQLGEPDPPLTYQITSGSLVAGDEFFGALSRDPGEEIGTYAIRLGTLSADSYGNHNYALTLHQPGGTLKIVNSSRFLIIGQPINGGLTPVLNTMTQADAIQAYSDDNSQFKLGSTVPVKFTLTDANGVPVTEEGIARLFVKQADNKPDPGVAEAISTVQGTEGNEFRPVDADTGQYIFNLSTKRGYTNPNGTVTQFTSQGTYTLSIMLNDGTSRSVNIQLVK